MSDGYQNVFKESRCPARLFVLFTSRRDDMKSDILRFQEELLIPALQDTPRNLLRAPEWMGFGGPGIGWADLSDEEARILAACLGPSAFKAIRFSPDIVRTVTNGRRKVVAGGSCLITSADHRRVVKESLPLGDLIVNLPNLPQLVDPLLAIKGAHMHLNILEDTLFAEGRPEIMGALQAQGCRHTTMLHSWTRWHGAQGTVEPCFFSRFPSLVEEVNRFMTRSFFRGQVAGGLSRSQVVYSFTGAWADLLRDQRAIAPESDYLVVEPYHHFTETMHVQTGVPGSPVHTMLCEMKRYFQAFPYGHGENAGVAGGIAFIPYMEPDGRLGFSATTSSATCHQGNVREFLNARELRLSCERIPTLSSDFLFADGVNCLYLFEACRAALYEIRQIWTHIEQATQHISDKQERRIAREAMRTSTDIKRLWLPPHEVLYTHLEMLLMSVFSHARLSQLAS
jgi:hypothetical protein